MSLKFKIARGSVRGWEHSRAGRNNQDAFALVEGRDSIVGVVCDGCGGAPFSEVGARLGAGLAARLLDDEFSGGTSGGGKVPEKWELAEKLESFRRSFESRLRGFVETMVSPIHETIRDAFLFSLLAVYVGPRFTFVAGIGDGCFSFNGESTILGPFPGNAPPYLAYNIFPEVFLGKGSEATRLPHNSCTPHPSLGPGHPPFRCQIHLLVTTFEVKTLLIGSDGFAEVLAAKPPNSRLERKETFSKLTDLCGDDGIFENPDALRRILFRANREILIPDWEARQIRSVPGLFRDDATVLVIRRVSPAENPVGKTESSETPHLN